MGYKKFGCVGKDYEVGHLVFLLIPIHLLSSLVGCSNRKGMSHEKKVWDTFKLLFSGLQLFCGEKLFF